MKTDRYEAASTIYGPHTLGAYIQQYTYLTQVTCPRTCHYSRVLLQAMLQGNQLQRGPPPPNLYDDQLSFVPGVVMDNPPLGQCQMNRF